jgi:hypothetical protein
VPVPEGLDGRDAADAVLRRERLVGVDVDLHEHEVAVRSGNLALEHRPESAAGAAPRGPEIDDENP